MTEPLSSSSRRNVLLLGFGRCASAFFRHSAASFAYQKVFFTTRDASKAGKPASEYMIPIVVPPNPRHSMEYTGCTDKDANFARQVKEAASGADVLISYPADKSSDECFASLMGEAESLVYISSTGVYDGLRGKIDEMTVPAPDPGTAAAARLEAEKIWTALGAVVLRAPALYGPGYGLHRRLLSGAYRLPGDGSLFSSRIHLDDLARIISGCFEHSELKGRTFPVGDQMPATAKEVCDWLCRRLSIPLPESTALENCHRTLRADRQIDGREILEILELELLFPTYKEGFEHCLLAESELLSTVID